MISSILSNSISGLRAAGSRILNSAENISHANTTGRAGTDGEVRGTFRPQQVQQTSVVGGGVETRRVPVTPATVPVYAPDTSTAGADGMVAMPNVSLETEAVHLVRAETAYRANLKVIETADEMLGVLLDRDS